MANGNAARTLPALAAVGVLGAVVIAGVAGGLGGGGGGDDQRDVRGASTTLPASVPEASGPLESAPLTSPNLGPTSMVGAVVATEEPRQTTRLAQPLGFGMAGTAVRQLQEELDRLGFFVGPTDGEFGNLTRQAVWAFKKLVMGVPRGEVDEIVTDDVWQAMQETSAIKPQREWRAGEATESHVEVYLPEQVVAFFEEDEAVLISHMSGGDGEEWREVVTIDVGEYGNENGSEPLRRQEIGVSVTPGGIFSFHRFVEGLRQSALGGMWNPGYFNYGIAIHGAQNVPLHPASHGCIRVPMAVGEVFHQYVDKGDQVFVWDGIEEPEYYAARPNAGYPRGQLPIFNRIDHEWAATSTTTTPPTTSTLPTTTQAPSTPAPATQAPSTPAPATQAPTLPPTQPPTTATTTTTSAPPTTTTTTTTTPATTSPAGTTTAEQGT